MVQNIVKPYIIVPIICPSGHIPFQGRNRISTVVVQSDKATLGQDWIVDFVAMVRTVLPRSSREHVEDLRSTPGSPIPGSGRARKHENFVILKRIKTFKLCS